jgi:putative transposase
VPVLSPRSGCAARLRRRFRSAPGRGSCPAIGGTRVECERQSGLGSVSQDAHRVGRGRLSGQPIVVRRGPVSLMAWRVSSTGASTSARCRAVSEWALSSVSTACRSPAHRAAGERGRRPHRGLEIVHARPGHLDFALKAGNALLRARRAGGPAREGGACLEGRLGTGRPARACRVAGGGDSDRASPSAFKRRYAWRDPPRGPQGSRAGPRPRPEGSPGRGTWRPRWRGRGGTPRRALRPRAFPRGPQATPRRGGPRRRGPRRPRPGFPGRVRPKPSAIDHGPQFTGAVCHALCEEWSVEQRLAPVGRPTGNAITERVILAMEAELIWARDWESAQELRDALGAWRLNYRQRRPHESLGWMTRRRSGPRTCRPRRTRPRGVGATNTVSISNAVSRESRSGTEQGQQRHARAPVEVGTAEVRGPKPALDLRVSFSARDEHVGQDRAGMTAVGVRHLCQRRGTVMTLRMSFSCWIANGFASTACAPDSFARTGSTSLAQPLMSTIGRSG